MNPAFHIDLQPQLVEEAVLYAITGHPEEGLFRKERDRLYESKENKGREREFQSLHEKWFQSMGLIHPLRQVLAVWPILTETTSRCLLIKARSKTSLGAELYLAPEAFGLGARARRTIVVQITSELLTQSEPSLDFFRHEFLHIVDMLDPNFGYEPNFPKTDAGPAYDALLQVRYGVLWDITIDGRLLQRGWLPQSARERHFDIFKRTFTGSAEKVEAAFSNFFDHNSHTHRELVEFAQQPQKSLSASSTDDSAKGRCALCHFPTFHLIKLSELQFELVTIIKKHYPALGSSQSICRQCADLYEARATQLGVRS
jgi:hypothetical protein